ncbi:hypothetical protein ACFORL_01925 [Legionella dresdenensis]|uniref:Uncharacterized protein n=1 Tax=Legionella dresdenensis TaxID=450200 RepID=A0ABV8CD08_9GAMM
MSDIIPVFKQIVDMGAALTNYEALRGFVTESELLSQQAKAQEKALQAEIGRKKTIDSLKDNFLKKHWEVFNKDLNGFFGCLRKTQVQDNWTLKEIIEHGMASNNRTRTICAEMGWLTKNGAIAELAPDEVKNLFMDNPDSIPILK